MANPLPAGALRSCGPCVASLLDLHGSGFFSHRHEEPRRAGWDLSVGPAVPSPPSLHWAWALEPQRLVHVLPVLRGSVLGSMGAHTGLRRVRSEGLRLVPSAPPSPPAALPSPGSLLTPPAVLAGASQSCRGFPLSSWYSFFHPPSLSVRSRAPSCWAFDHHLLCPRNCPSMCSGPPPSTPGRFYVHKESYLNPCSVLLLIPCFPNTLLLVLLYFSLFCSLSHFQVCMVH